MQSLINNIIDEGVATQMMLTQLEDAFKEYPYSPTLAVLLTKAYKEQNNIHFEAMLSRSALLAQQRKNLHAMLYALTQAPVNQLPIESIDNEGAEATAASASSNINTKESSEFQVSTPLNDANNENTFQGSDTIIKDHDELLTNQYLAEALSAGVLSSLEFADSPDSLRELESVKEEQTEVDDAEIEISSSATDSATIDLRKSEPEKLGFTAWLDHLSGIETDNKDRVENQFKEETNEKVNEITDVKINQALENQAQNISAIINRFIQKEDEIVPKRARFFTPEKAARESLEDKATIVTETLARIYAEQGNTSKAISTYEKLSLLHPEKSSYFAALISNLKKD